jgi:hypothetical protein
MSNRKRRVPQNDSEFATYLTTTMLYLPAPFKSPIVQPLVAATNTINLLHDESLPDNLIVTLTNTGTAGIAPPLYFCMANTDSCNPAAAIQVTAGMSQSVTIKQLGGSNKYNLNVTNIHPTDDTGCLVEFQPNWQRLGLLEEQKQQWENMARLWLAKYTASQDPTKRTTTLVAEKNDLKSDFTEFADSPLKTIEGSTNIVNADYDIFNISKRDNIPTPREPIAQSPFTGLKGGDGCRATFTHRTENDANRASKHPDADAIETRWILLDALTTPPNTPDDCPNIEIYTKAKHTMQFPISSAGKRLHTFSRWRNNAETQKSSPWGLRISIMLSE